MQKYPGLMYLDFSPTLCGATAVFLISTQQQVAWRSFNSALLINNRAALPEYKTIQANSRHSEEPYRHSWSVLTTSVVGVELVDL